MAHVFRIHKTGVNQLKGWDSVPQLGDAAIKSIQNVADQKGNTAKIGSSIPSPFARMYLFETAFRMLGDGTGNPQPEYEQIVSDCLDLFQFLYLYANSGDITFIKWNKDKQLTEMAKSSHPQHNKLADSLGSFFNGTQFKGVKDIYLIYYKNELVGGTSPLTVLYTSPNWFRIVKQNGWEFPTPAGDLLFDEDPWSIEKRDPSFQEYIYKFVYANSHPGTNLLGDHAGSFFNYFAKAAGRHQNLKNIELANNLGNGYSPANLDKDYAKIAVNPNSNAAANLVSGNCFLYQPKPRIGNITSDFIMTPSQSFFAKRTDSNGKTVKNLTPLVLMEGTFPGMNYLNKSWDAMTKVPKSPMTAVNDRKLPNQAIKYPYITTGDFLEPALIELPYYMAKDRFFTGFAGNFKYLLPVKKAYFTYFSLSDLKKQLVIQQTADAVTVTLNIPVANGVSIPLKKIYDLNSTNDVVKQKGITGFNLGIFPFYQVTDDVNLNKYAVSLVSNVADLSLDFYRFDEVNLEKTVDTAKEIRTRGGGKLLQSAYYHINEETFDCIELKIGSIAPDRGLIIPSFTLVEANNSTASFDFAVDFGTSNTHIAYNKNGVTKSFDITPSDRQMVLLSETKMDSSSLQNNIAKGTGNLSVSVAFFDNEFAPNFIEENAKFIFPTRTVASQHAGYTPGNAKIFTNTNIGFNLEHDTQTLTNNKYFTNLKWEFGNTRTGEPKERVEMYFSEVLWLLKNKMLLNGGGKKATIVWMVPYSMSSRMIDMYQDVWEEQVNEIFGGKNEITLQLIYESVAPYYAPQLKIKKGENVVNIDIGGGTTDILFFSKTENRYYSTSFRFAGNDIWGEGLSNGNTANMDNGFYTMMETKIGGDNFTLDNSSLVDIFNKFKDDNNLDSADSCSLFFRHDDKFKFSEHIKAHKALPIILIFHLSAIIYHVCEVIKAKNIEVPKRFSFTGKGSSYLNLIGRQRNIENLVNILLETFLEDKFTNKITVSIADNPKELTAAGAVSSDALNNAVNIGNNTEKLIYHGQSAQFTQQIFSEAKEQESKVKSDYLNFLKKMDNVDLRNFIGKQGMELEVGIKPAIEFLAKNAADSFNNMYFTLEDDGMQSTDPLDETMFFWFLKDALYEFSKTLYTN